MAGAQLESAARHGRNQEATGLMNVEHLVRFRQMKGRSNDAASRCSDFAKGVTWPEDSAASAQTLSYAGASCV